MSCFSCTAWTLNDRELIQASTAPVAAKIPLKSRYFTFFPRQLGYENAENVQSFGQAMMQTRRSEPRKAAPWQRGWQSQALSLLRRVQCRKMFLECICDSLSLALCLGAYINTAAAKIPNKLKQNKNVHSWEHCHSRAHISQLKWRSVINYISDSLRISLSCSVLAV